jgi:hypothetical protein
MNAELIWNAIQNRYWKWKNENGKDEDAMLRDLATAAALVATPPAPASAVDKRLYDVDAPMADGETRMTAAEEILAWLLVEKIGVPDDRPYTPSQAQEIIVRALRPDGK